MNVYILADMEGISLVTEWEQVDQAHPSYTKYQQVLTAEVNAAVEGALAAGATRIVVNDGHGSSDYNILWREVQSVVEIERPDAEDNILPSLNETFDAMLLIGYHAMEGTPNAVLAHTQNHKTWRKYRINGIEYGEIGQMSVIAGASGVPVAYISGDRAAVEEAKKLLGANLPGTIVKQGYANGKATSLHPAKAAERIREDVEAALRLPRREPLQLEGPYEISVTFKSEQFADSFIEGKKLQRIDSWSVSKRVEYANHILHWS